MPPSTPRNPADVFLVTGAASGIGRHMTGRLLALGKRVLATDVNLSELRKAATAEGWPAPKTKTRGEQKLELRKLDVRSAKDWESAVKATLKNWGRLDVLLNNAGYLLPGYIHEVSAEEIDRHIDINTKGVLLGAAAAARVMKEQKSGHIINMASLAGVAPISGLTLYSASKYAVRGASLAMTEDLRPHNVYVTAVCPDVVQTRMFDLQKNYEQAALSFSGGRVLTVEDIEKVILGRVLKKKPREVLIPGSRGLLAKIGNFLPSLAAPLGGSLRRKGLNAQARFKNAN